MTDLDAPARAGPADRALLDRRGTGAQPAFGMLVRRHSAVLYAVARRRLDSASDAEETVQDAFMLLWRKRSSVRLAGDSALPWLIVSVKHLAANRRRSVLRRARHETANDAVERAGTESHEGPTEVRDLVQRALDRLPPLDAAVARLCLAEDLTYAEAAARVGLTESAVRNRLSRTRARLRRDLNGDRP